MIRNEQLIQGFDNVGRAEACDSQQGELSQLILDACQEVRDGEGQIPERVHLSNLTPLPYYELLLPPNFDPAQKRRHLCPTDRQAQARWAEIPRVNVKRRCAPIVRVQLGIRLKVRQIGLFRSRLTRSKAGGERCGSDIPRAAGIADRWARVSPPGWMQVRGCQPRALFVG